MDIKCTIATSLELLGILDKILFEKSTDAEGKAVYNDREIPFDTRYKLHRDKILFEKDNYYFEQMKKSLIEKYGEVTEDGEYTKVTDDNLNVYREEIYKVLGTEVTHNIQKLTPENMDGIKITNISSSEMNLLIALLIDDPDLQADMNTSTNLASEPTPEPEA